MEETDMLFKMLNSEDINKIHNIMEKINEIKRNGNLSDIETFIDALNKNFQYIDIPTKDLDFIYLAQKQTEVLSEENFIFLLEKSFDKEEDHEKKYQLALERPDYEKFQKYIDEYKKNKSVNIPHSLSDKAEIGETDYTDQTEDFTIGLFKSKQEKLFYSAARSVFPNCFVCPNVAISCIIDIERIKGYLDEIEIKFSYKGIVDCVIYENVYNENDNYVNFKPIYFIELDSDLHKDPKRKANDKLKDSIFGKAGLQIMRINPKSQLSIEDFEIMLIEKIERSNKDHSDTTTIKPE